MVMLRVEAQVVNTTSPAPLEATHVNDLGDLQEYDHSHDPHDLDTHGDNIFLNKVQVKIPVS